MATRRAMVIPPGGFAGFGQQSPATQQLFSQAARLGSTRTGPKRRRRKAKAKRAAPKRRRKTAAPRKGRARLVKGSAAAKRYMAKIRRKRK